MLAKRRGSTAIAVLTLSLGIASSTVVFSIASTVLWVSLPFRAPERLVTIEEIHKGGFRAVGMDDFSDWRAENSAFQDMALTMYQELTLTGQSFAGSSEPVRIVGRKVTASYFPLLGVSPKLGRWFLESKQPRVNVPWLHSDQDDSNAVILSFDFWKKQFGGKPDIIGQSITLDGAPYRIIGVMPSSFRSYETGEPATCNVWTLLRLVQTSRDVRQFRAVARLKPEVSLAAAQAQMTVIAQHLEREYPSTNTGWRVIVKPLQNELAQDLRPALLMLLAAVCFVLLIACANVGNLLLVQAVDRTKEVSIRVALGAGRLRLFEQALAESVLLAIAAGFLGVLFSLWALHLLPIVLQNSAHFEWIFSVNKTMFVFALSVSLLTAMLFGLAPTLNSLKADTAQNLKESFAGSNRRPTRFFSAFVVGQVMLAFVLIVGSGLLISSFRKLTTVNPGFTADNLLTMKITVPSTGCAIDQECVHFFPVLLAQLRAIPGVISAAAVSGLPMSGYRSGWPIGIEGRAAPVDEAQMMVIWHAATPGYFRTMGIPLLRGRLFDERDTGSSQPVLLINNRAARQFWPGENPVGQRVTVLGGPWREIVGVVGDVKSNGLTARIDPEIYIPFLQVHAPAMFVVLRTLYNPKALQGTVRTDVHKIDSVVPISDMGTMENTIHDSLWKQREVTELLSIFAFLAGSLALMGIYVVMARSVTRRTHEVGVRMALGATRSHVLYLFVRRGIFLALIGEVAGLGLWLSLAHLMGSLLFGVQPTDPTILIGGSLLLTTVALSASLIPAARAATIDPSTALRYE